MNDFKVLLQAVLDSSGIGKSDIAEVQKVLEKYHVNLTADLNKAEIIKTIKQIVPELEAELKKITGIDIKINEADLLKAINQVEKNSIQAAKAEEKLVDTMERVRAKSEQARQAEEKRQQLAQDKASNRALEEEYVLREKIAQQSKEIQLSTGDNGNITTQIEKMTNDFEKLGLSGDEAKNKMSAVNNEFSQLKTVIASGNNNAIVNQFDKLKTTLGETQNGLKILRSEQSLLASESKRLSTANSMTSWLENNSKASKLFGADIKQMVETLRSADDLTVPELNKIDAAFKKIQSSSREMKLLGKTWGDSFKADASKFASWLLPSSGVMTAINGLRKMKDSVIEIDTAMTNLYKVTDETSTKYNSFLEGANKSAQELGRSVSSLVEQASEWAKLGFTIDDSAELAKVSSIYANVGEVDDKTAVSDLVTAMKALNIESSKSINIVDELNNLSNRYAVSAAGLGEGLKNSASALALQGNSLEQILALLTGGGEITQEVGELGNMLKVSSLRLASMKGQLEEIGENYDDIVSVSKNQTQIYNFTKGQVNILDEQNNKLKDTYTILEDVAKAWNDVDSLEKSELLELLFGKQRANQGAAIIQAFQSGQIQKALEDAMTSDGSAYAEQEKWLESIEAKLGQFEAAFQSLSNTVIDSDLIKFFIDFGTAGTNAMESLIKFITPLGALGAGIGALASHQLSLKGLDFHENDYANLAWFR